MQLLNVPFLFHYLRRLVNGNYFAEFHRLLDLRPGDRLLDVGCGVGEASCLAGNGVEYVGLDVDEGYIDYARKLYGRPGVSFVHGDIQVVEGEFSKAIVVCALHHLCEQQVLQLGQRLHQLVGGPVGVVDPDAERSNWFQRIFLYLDRGDHIFRPIRGHLAPLEELYDCQTLLTRDTRLRGARLTYSVCQPKR
ncbi:MAG: class I SAM-dependent methyltransferase [Candidatus Eremiobacteraeota bacterium]|nr:class I SAM-dependent methyltransferase [Candidatus Eremiobacteraeota bacterium]